MPCIRRHALLCSLSAAVSNQRALTLAPGTWPLGQPPVVCGGSGVRGVRAVMPKRICHVPLSSGRPRLIPFGRGPRFGGLHPCSL